MNVRMTRIETPIGELAAVVEDGKLTGLALDGRAETLSRLLSRRYGAAQIAEGADRSGVVAKLSAYFRGDLDALGQIEADPSGTPFQMRVWKALRRIPLGRTISYGALAAKIGDAKAVRAVGAANGANPVPVVIPCHRVIAADGSLHGYGGGLDRKRWLLVHEGAILA
jgi:methylated-DNA-[protein]-cysteine S-methyltransferase